MTKHDDGGSAQVSDNALWRTAFVRRLEELHNLSGGNTAKWMAYDAMQCADDRIAERKMRMADG